MSFLSRSKKTFRPAKATTSGEQNSLALQRLLEDLPTDRKLFVLDFGSASPGTVDFFSGRSCRIFFEDFYRAWQEREAGAQLSEEVLQRLLPFEAGIRFDVIFLWDTLNYLEQDALASLLRYLESFANPGAAMTVLLSLSPEMPLTPADYRITERGTVRFDVASNAKRRSPCYSPDVLKKLLKKFELERLYLLRSGQREAVFVIP